MDQKKKNFAIAQLRRGSYKWPARSACVKASRIDRGLYKCNLCAGEFKRKDMTADHVEPVVDPLKGFDGFDNYVERLLADPQGWQYICRPCHAVKTASENIVRKETSKKKRKDTKKRS